MQMKFQLLANLLSNTRSLLYSAYVALCLSVLSILLKGWLNIELISYLMIVFLLCAMQHYISIRLKLDADLLKHLAEQSVQKTVAQLTKEMDQALLYFKLMPAKKSARDWSIRFQGCMKLFKIQIGLLFLQYFILALLIFKLLSL
ncbi:hypothetical protein EC844_11785 [Acinetobacter calcoaceticus]|uniref:Uncharacterized protein n=1 Tax=Acinetobacter calcoaceticus TaxID=471 RepID=A0A4R1XKK2_ACICA|nr:hypothetical protein EC844_11785 [Acinetobacter calcoaceticus]